MRPNESVTEGFALVSLEGAASKMWRLFFFRGNFTAAMWPHLLQPPELGTSWSARPRSRNGLAAFAAALFVGCTNSRPRLA
jgi:hypothetical protein